MECPGDSASRTGIKEGARQQQLGCRGTVPGGLEEGGGIVDWGDWVKWRTRRRELTGARAHGSMGGARVNGRGTGQRAGAGIAVDKVACNE